MSFLLKVVTFSAIVGSAITFPAAVAQSGAGVSTPAAASPNPVTGTTAALSALGTDSAGEASLTYTWSGTGPASVTFTPNGTNAAKNTIAVFQSAGTYNLTVLIADPAGSTATTNVAVTVNQTPATVNVTPGTVSVATQATQQFSASITDQFGNPMDPPGGVAGWNTLPNTMLQSVCPPNFFGGQNYPFSYNCAQVIRAWSGGIADTKRNRIIIWGGGHQNYYGNEVYSLNLSDNPQTLTRLTDPSPINTSQVCIPTLADGKPNARESFSNLIYMQHVDKMFSFQGALACGNGSSVEDTWTLDLGTLQWTRMDPVNGSLTPAISGASGGGRNYAVTAYDPNTRTVLLVWLEQMWRYTYETNTYELLSTQDHVPYASTGALDTKRKLFVFMGQEYQNPPSTVAAPHIWVIDVSGNTPYVSQEWTSQVSGCDGLASAFYPGLVYDPVLDRIVGWPNTGNTLYLFNPDTKTCTTQSFPNGPPRPPRADGSGAFGRFNYFPALGTYGLVEDADENAYTLRMTSAPTGVAWFVDGGGSISPSGLFTAGSAPGGPFNVSARIGTAVGAVPITVSGSPLVPVTNLTLNLGLSETSGTTNGSIVTPTLAPAGFTGSVVVNGTGSVNFTPAQSGNGAYFLNCCGNTNNAYYKFSGSTIGNIFNVNQGQISFYLQSRHSFAQRQAISSLAAFDVRDNNPTNHVFDFLTQASGSLRFIYTVAGTQYSYYVPAGTEDSLFGSGVTLKVAISWDAASVKLYLNDNLVQLSSYSRGSSNWTAASNFDVGAYEYLTYGGYYTSDDAIAGFTVMGPPVPSNTVQPLVSVTSPANGASVSGTVTISANAIDPLGIASVQFLLDGVSLGTVPGGTSSTYSISWNTAATGNGPHALKVIATDTSGSSATSVPISVTVSNSIGPVVSITAPSGGASVSGTVVVSANASGSTTVAQVQFLLDGNKLGAADITTPYSVSWNTVTALNGNHTLTVVATDVAGNSATSASVSVTVTNTGVPVVSLTAPLSGASLSGTVAVSANATDSAGITMVQFQLDGNNLGTPVAASPYTINWSTATALNGSHTLTAVATNFSGNTASSAGVPVTVTNTVSGPPSQGLLGYWTFNENAGAAVNDTSGNGYNGTISGASWVPGYIGSALSFNGGSNYVATSAIPFTNSFSVSAWVNPNVTTQGPYTRIAETQYNTGFFLGVNSAGTKYKFIVNGATGATGTCGAALGCAEGGTVSSGWHLVTGTYDGATASLYVDGTQVATETFKAPSNVTLPLYIGRYYGASGYGWNGVIDELRLYSRALFSSEVSAIYNYNGQGTTPPAVTITTPANGATISGTTVLTANATSSSGIAGVQFQMDGTTSLGGVLTGSGPAYSYSWSTTLVPDGAHTITATATDKLGNTGATTISITLANGSVPPSIGTVAAGSLTPYSATITWLTDQSSDSQVAYGANSSYGSASPLNSALVTSHSVNLTGLTPSTTYHYQVLSRNSSGVLAASADFSFTTGATGISPSGILIVYRANGPDNNNNGISDSLELAQYYAQQRNVPQANLLPVTLSQSSAYGQGQYTTFYSEMVAPIKNALASLGPTNINVILLAGEFPALVYDGSNNARSVDTALMGINALGSASGSVIAQGNNPYFDPAPGFDTPPGHFSQLLYQYGGTTMYLVTRLGSDSSLRGIDQVDQSLYGDLYISPLPGYYNGVAYVDSLFGSNGSLYTDAFLSGTTAVHQGLYDNSNDADMNIGYAEHYVLASGFPLKWENTAASLSIGDAGATFSDGTSAATAPNALFYGGWYNFNKYNNVWQWLAGSVACDLNSGSYFALQALDHGASAASYVISEPFVNGAPRPNILYYYLLNGYSFAEASALATPFVGWMGVNEGDPLYAPLRTKTAVVDTQAPALVSGYPTLTVNPSTGSAVMNLLVSNTAGPKVVKAQVQYGPDTNYGTTATSTGYDSVVEAAGAFTRHPKVSLPWSRGAVYHYRIVMTDPAGNVTTTGDFTDTPTVSITTPANGATVSGAVQISANATDAGGIASVQFMLDGNNLGAPVTGAGPSYSLSWDSTTATNVTHILTAIATNTEGNVSTSATVSVTVNNAVAPVISAISVSSVSSSSATITWTTDQASTSEVAYGTTTAYGSLSPLNSSLVTPHSVTLTGLTPSTTYDFDVQSQNAPGALAISANNVFTTFAASGPPAAGLLGYWAFNENTGTVANDFSGNGYTGTISGATWVAGHIGSGLSFDGSAKYVKTASIPFTNSFSISAWVNPTVTTQSSYTRIAETQYYNGLFLGVNSSGTKYKFIVNGGTGTTGTCGNGYGCAEGGTVSSGWHLVTGTYNGSTAILYLDGIQVATETFTAPASISLPLYIGRYYAASGYGWNGVIDDLRLYSRALTASEVSTIYSYNGATPPAAPANVIATAVSPKAINVTWSASSDSLGVTGYQIYRNGALAGTTSGLSFADTGLASSTTYGYTVAAFDAGGNVSAQSSPSVSATTLTTDTTLPNVSVTLPTTNSNLSGTVTVSATATDNSGVASVQFRLDGIILGAPLTSAPYSSSWDTTTAANGSHTLTAVATDTSGNTAISTGVPVTVSNTVSGPPTIGLLAYWAFNENTGTVANDGSGNGHNGTISGSAWVPGYIGSALSFNGSSNYVSTGAIPFTNAFSISAWVNPAVTTQGAYARIAETQYNTGLFLGINSTGTKYKVIVNGGNGTTGTCGAAYGCAEGGTVSSGWHLVTGTYDGATVILYVDGTQVATETFTTPASVSLPLYIGRYYGGTGYGWNGAIDEVRLYGRALTGGEVSAVYSYTGNTQP